ncbi:TPM domain-containing protein [Bacteroides sp. 214]|uniref:TPM domain-containing protein n=1 Tax=Bacteroides sp. 214 TaxID=2302935 RepID=UPI0013D24959|nr:TPM domain-containing protein [Bacteroides sp. 214]NDW11688.1 TPM domain-containing protein [Bacteroides sp. 214]
MRQLYTILLLFAISLSVTAQKVYTTNNIPKVHLQDARRYVCDPENIISNEARTQMDDILYQLEQETGIETVVAVLPSIGSEDCFEFSHRLLNDWGVGKQGKDNGLVILLVTDQRCVQFYTGYGLEGDLPDAICKRIQTQEMIPYLKNGDWSNGMIAGIEAVYKRLDGSMENDEDEWTSEDTEILLITMLFFIGMIVVITLSFLVERHKKKCPNCKKHTLQRTNSKILSVVKGVRTEELTFTCQNCGHKVVRKVQHSNNSNHGSGGGFGPIIGGGLGGSRGGGRSFGGGSFGGGRGGGGGAGSRF